MTKVPLKREHIVLIVGTFAIAAICVFGAIRDINRENNPPEYRLINGNSKGIILVDDTSIEMVANDQYSIDEYLIEYVPGPVQYKNGWVQNVQQTRIKTEIDCVRHLYRWTAFRHWNVKNQVVADEKFDSDGWEEIRRGSEYDIEQLVCKKSAPGFVLKLNSIDAIREHYYHHPEQYNLDLIKMKAVLEQKLKEAQDKRDAMEIEQKIAEQKLAKAKEDAAKLK